VDNSKQKAHSFEFFPPKTAEGAEKLRQTREQLAALHPRYISVTFGAGGSTQQGTLDTITEIQNAGIPAAPHMSCISSSKEDLYQLLKTYQEIGIKRIVALRGDMPSGTKGLGELRYANELVAFIREKTGDYFHLEVAAYPEVHPQARDAESDLHHFKLKIEAGANSAITQYFYNPDAYFNFIERCHKAAINAPIVPGIMPITNYKMLARFSDSCGAEIPRWVRKQLEGYGDDLESIRKFGIDVTTDLCRKLLEFGVPGLHFYTMNQAGPTMEIWDNLNL